MTFDADDGLPTKTKTGRTKRTAVCIAIGFISIQLLIWLVVDRQTPTGLVSRAEHLIEEGRYDEAIVLLNKAIAKAPTTSIAFTERGFAFLKKGKLNDAKTDFDAALEFSPKNEVALKGRCSVYLTKHELTLAENDCDAAIAIDPNYEGALQQRGLVYYAQNRLDLALADFTKALTFNPPQLGALVGRAVVYQKQGEFDLAIKDIAEAIGLHPEVVPLLAIRGEIEENQAEYDLSLKDFTLAIGKNPSLWETYAARGRVFFYQGNFPAAAQDLQTFLLNMPESPYKVLWLHLVHLHMAVEDKAEFAGNAARLKGDAWPRPVVDFYLGNITADDVLAKAKSAQSETERNQICEADFYIGESSLAAGDAGNARRLFQNALDICPKDFVEYSGTQAELKRLPAH